MITTLVTAVIVFIFLMLTKSAWMIMASLFLLGFACANIFAIAFSNALQMIPSKANEISALMITGVAGGALVPPLMGVIADASNQFTSLFILLIALLCILLLSVYIIRK
jgi:fucose permease